MKDKLRIFPMKALAAFSLIMGGIPLSILTGRLFAPDMPALWLLLPFAVWVWTLIGYLLPAKGRLPFSLLGCALLCVILVAVLKTNVFATVIPLLFPRIGIAFRPMIDRKRGVTPPGAEGSDLID